MAKIDGSAPESGAFGGDGGLVSAARSSFFSQPTALAFKFSYGQCSSVSLMNASRELSDGWACRIDVVSRCAL